MESMTEAYGTGVPDSIGRYDYDQERSENVGGPIEDAYYYDDGNGHGIAIENEEWTGGYTISRQKFGPAVTDCLLSSKPVSELGEYETRQQAFEAAQKEFGPGRLQKAISAARQLLG